MLKFALDENFNGDIVRGLRRRRPGLDLARVQDVGLTGADDPTVLGWAAAEGRVLFTHVFEVSPSAPVRQGIEDM
jgi:predicted nuclease of predicted toxin-antitoxin system